MENKTVELIWTGRGPNMLLGSTVYSGQRLQVGWLLAKQKHEEGRGWFCPQYDEIVNKVEQEVEASISTPVEVVDEKGEQSEEPKTTEKQETEEPKAKETANIVEAERQKLLELAEKRKEQLRKKKAKNS